MPRIGENPDEGADPDRSKAREGGSNASSPDQERGPLWRSAFGASLALAMGVGPLAVYVLSALAPAITEELSLSRTQLGALATISFLVTAGLAVSVGDVIDRVSARATMVSLFLIGGASLLGIGLAPDYWTLMVAVAISGLVQALSNPVTNQTIATLLPPGRRGLIMGVKQSGVQMCQFLAGASLPILAVALGWRGATLIMPVVAIAGLAISLAVIPRAPAVRARLSRHQRRQRARLPTAVWWLASYSFLVGMGLQSTNVYLPLFAYEQVGLGEVLAGGTTGVLGGVGVLSRMVWGRSAERVSTLQRPLAFLAIGGIGAVVLLLLSPTFPVLIWVGVIMHALSAVAANVVVSMAIVRIVDVSQLGRASGGLALGLYLGFAVGPVVFGALADRTGSYNPGWMTLLGIYAVAAALTQLWLRSERARS